jgi:alpha,alpha-trehalase
MNDIELRPAFPAEEIDPLDIAPDPGEMGQMYIGAREKYEDGMMLACATPILPYDEVIERYVEERDQPEFSDVKFFEKYFALLPMDDESFIAEPGQSVEDYTLGIRDKFIFPNTKQGYFDIWLPHDRAVAGGGRFNMQSFLWDGYQMAKGYAADGRLDLVINILDNTEYEISTFGHPLNGSAAFYATRAQPDYFAHEVRLLSDRIGPEALVRYLPAMEKNHMGYWMDGMEELSMLPDDGKAHAHRTLVRMPDGSFLNRYWDDAEGPRIESYKEDVDVATLAVEGLKGAVREARMRKVYQDLRAGAASGWDYSSRWFEDGSNIETINTTDIAPIDLNSLMAYNEETLAMAYEAAAEMDDQERSKWLEMSGILQQGASAEAEGYSRAECFAKSAMFQKMADDRKDAINTYLWDPKDKIFRDYNFEGQYQTAIVSAAMAYPLYVGIANEEQTLGVADAIERELLYEGGIIATTTESSTQQWDGGKRGGKRSKNVWAPPNWAAVRGLARMAHLLTAQGMEIDAERLFKLAEKVQANYMNGVKVAFLAQHMVPEKHRGDDPAKPANGGEYALVKVLAMPSETFRAMLKLDVRNAADHLTKKQMDRAA